MKFETHAHKIVVKHQPNFHKDLCKDARARGVNACSRDETGTTEMFKDWSIQARGQEVGHNKYSKILRLI